MGVRSAIGERLLALLQELSARTAGARTAEEACTRSALALQVDPHDLPFAMVVDDNLDRAGSLTTLLGLLGHETRTVHDGPAALVAARELLPAAVLLEIGLLARIGEGSRRHAGAR